MKATIAILRETFDLSAMKPKTLWIEHEIDTAIPEIKDFDLRAVECNLQDDAILSAFPELELRYEYKHSLNEMADALSPSSLDRSAVMLFVPKFRIALRLDWSLRNPPNAMFAYDIDDMKMKVEQRDEV